MKKFIYLLLICCLTAITSLSAQDIFFNEIEYSPDDSPTSTDGVGIFGPAGTDLTGYTIHVYDNSGTIIQIIPLTGIIQADLPVIDRGEIWVDIPIFNVTNGGQGVALINPSGITEQFVNFGTVNETITTMIGGISITSEYIGAHDTGKSIQVVGVGCSFLEFSLSVSNVYVNTQDPSHGELNENQVVDCMAQGALPIEIISFKGQQLSEKEILLSWITASETNNYLTELQHSTDGLNFISIHKEYESGDKTTETEYKYTDRLFVAGKNYYRLLQIDLDGTASFLDGIVIINAIKNKQKLAVYPNPITDYVQVSLKGFNSQSAPIEIYNLLGQCVQISFINLENESQRIDLSSLVNGTYIIHVANLSAIIQKH